jgi:hypothetical protein
VRGLDPALGERGDRRDFLRAGARGIFPGRPGVLAQSASFTKGESATGRQDPPATPYWKDVADRVAGALAARLP